MNINPILMEGGGQALERRSGWLRAAERGSPDVARTASEGTSVKSEVTSGFDATDQLSKGLIGRVATSEWQGKIDFSQDIQVADQAMQAIDEKLQQAKADLTEIHKMFPPYPHGSQERADFLNSFKSLRMQIDKLVFPPESDTAAHILGGAPVGETPSEVGRFPVNPGTGGLELVEVEKPVEELGDEELPAILEDLDRASGVLHERRMSLEASVGKIFNQEAGEEIVFAKLSMEVQEKFAALDISMGRPQTGVHRDLPFLD